MFAIYAASFINTIIVVFIEDWACFFIMASSSSSSSSSSLSSHQSGVSVPVYELAPASILRAVENASSLEGTCSDDAGEFYSMAMAESVAAGLVPDGAVIVLPLAEPLDDQHLDFTFLASSPLVFLRVFSKPQPRMTYCQVAGYTEGARDRPLGLLAKVRFPSVANYLVAKRDLLEAIQDVNGPGLDVTSGNAKRVCARQPEAGGELAVDAVEKAKGAYPLIMTDLDDATYPTRSKTDLVQRERELYLVLRMMDVEKREYVMTTDMAIQPELYRSTICEMSDTLEEDLLPAFTACTLISRIQGLSIFRDKSKMKSLLTGSVLVDSSAEPTLTLEDFVIGSKISNKSSACPSNNVGMISMLENLQVALQVVFSDEFLECFKPFIEDLHGVKRPMQLVAADLLRFSVETTLRKFFRIVRSVRGSSLPDLLSLKTPKLCVEYLKSLFAKLSVSLSHFPTMQQHEAYFRFRLSRRSEPETPTKSADRVAKVVTPTVTFQIAEKGRSQGAPPQSPKTCAGYMGGLLGAVNKDGRPYMCKYGSGCSFQHVSPAGKSDDKLMQFLDTMSPIARTDLRKAIRGKALKKV